MAEFNSLLPSHYHMFPESERLKILAYMKSKQQTDFETIKLTLQADSETTKLLKLQIDLQKVLSDRLIIERLTPDQLLEWKKSEGEKYR